MSAAAAVTADVPMSDSPVAVSSSAAAVSGKVKKPRGPRKAKTTADAASVVPAPKSAAAKAAASDAGAAASGAAAPAGKRPPTRFDVGNPAHYCNLAAFWTFRRNQRNSLKRTTELLAKHEAALAAARAKPDSVPAEKVKEWEDEATHLRGLIARYDATISTLQEHKQEVNTTVEHIYRLGSICSQTSVPAEADALARDCLSNLAKGMTPRPAKMSAAGAGGAADADAE